MPERDSSKSTIPAEPQFRYVVGLTRTIAADIAAYYDVVVQVPPGTAEAPITAHAAEKVTGHIERVTVDDLTPSHHELEAVVLDADYREKVPATLATIEFVEDIRYQHDGKHCEGVLFDVEASTAKPARLEALVVATQIDGAVPDEQAIHRIPLGHIEANLEADDA